jgi:hypothetical protein
MASSGKKKTTMAKLTRESRLRERRLDKKARKDARKQAAAGNRGVPSDLPTGQTDDPAPQGAAQASRDGVVPVLTDA